MSNDIEDLKKLEQYFNKRVGECSNSIYANGYDSENNISTAMNFYDEMFLEIKNIINLSSAEQVLDVGCGTGEILYRLNKLTTGAKGIDISKEMVKFSTQRGLNVKHYDGVALPFDKDSFNSVIIYHVLINLSPSIARNLIQEAGRVIKPSGKIFIGATPHPQKSGLQTHAGNWRTRLKNSLGIKQSIQYFSYDYSFFSKEFDRLAFPQVSFFPSAIQLPKWNSRFHVLFNC
jgi:ubiquinone/menaquinone biosynthesis C-methylase UbiE